MSVAIFLDVDQVLTKYPVQIQFARMLGVLDELGEVEAAFRERRASNDQFNRILIPTFAGAGFTEQYAKENFGNIELRPWAEQLLSVDADIYLVSSGPSYYIKLLAERWKIPQERVLCSEYEFAEDGRLRSCTRPISLHSKGEFVNKYAANYRVSIGLGDNVEQDAPFLQRCTIPILTKPSDNYVVTQKLECVAIIVERLIAAFPTSRKERVEVFIGSSKEAINVAEYLQLGLKDKCDTVIWTQGVFTPGHVPLESLSNLVNQFDFAVLVFSPQDVVVKRGVEMPAVRDNVIFELGLFMGCLGRHRTFFLYDQANKPDIPSDLFGITPLTYNFGSNLQAALGPACTQIKQAISQQGVMPSA